MTETFSWDALKRDDYFVDYQNLITHLGVISQRSIFVQAANAFLLNQQPKRALEMLDMCQECVPDTLYPIETVCIGFTGNDYMVITMVDQYLMLGQREKGLKLAARLSDGLLTSVRYFLPTYPYSKSDLETCTNYIYYLVDILQDRGEKEMADMVTEELKKLVSAQTSGAS